MSRQDEDWEMQNVKDSRKFFNKVAVWLAMSVVFIYLNATGGSSFPWAVFPIVFWGMSLFQDGRKLFGKGSTFQRKYRERQREDQSSLDMPDADRLDLPREMHDRETAQSQQKNWRDKDLV